MKTENDSPLRSLRPCWTTFLRILHGCFTVLSHLDIRDGYRPNEFFLSLLDELSPKQAIPNQAVPRELSVVEDTVEADRTFSWRARTVASQAQIPINGIKAHAM